MDSPKGLDCRLDDLASFGDGARGGNGLPAGWRKLHASIEADPAHLW